MKDISAKEEFICTKCNSTKSSTLISTTGFVYEYCCECNSNLNEIEKQIELDFIFKELANFLENSNLENSNNEYLNIELIKNSSFLKLIINGDTILNHKFTYELSNTDIYFIENTVFELVEDSCNSLKAKSNIIICA